MGRAVWIVLTAVLLAGMERTEAQNILLMIGDDHGLDAGCYGNSDVDTPNLDRLARQGTRFINAFAAVSSCSPSRSVLLTGQFTHTTGQYGLAHGAHNQFTRTGVRSLPAILNEAGYRTAIIGKNHVQPESVYPYQSAQPIPGQGRDVVAAARRVEEIFASDDARPFFLVVGFVDPHRAGKLFGNSPDVPGEYKRNYDPARLQVPDFLPDDPDVRHDLAEYYESVSRMDHGVGLVLDALERSGKRDSTLVIYVSDNGMPFPGAKTNLYDWGVRLPLLMRVPGSPEGISSQALASFIDIAPTALEFAKVGGPKNLPGRSLLPLTKTGETDGREAVFASHTFHEIWMYYPMRMVRTHRHKLIWNMAHTLEYPVASDIARSPSWEAIRRVGHMNRRSPSSYLNRPEFELFDLEKDPTELHNVADDPKYAHVKAELLERLKEMMEQTRDPWHAWATRND